MKPVTTLAVLALLVSLSAGVALAQQAEQATIDGQALLNEVQLLARLVPLKLTSAQIDSLLKLYDDQEAARQGILASPAGQTLSDIKQRLLLGQVPTDADQKALRDLSREAYSDRSPTFGGGELLDRVAQVLTPWQLAWAGLQMNPGVAADKQREHLAGAAFPRLKKAVSVPEEDWQGIREFVASALAAGIADPKDRALTEENLVDFLDRLRRLGPEGIDAQKDELAEELLALLPDGVPLGWEVPETSQDAQAEQAPRDRGRERVRSLAVFLSPDMPRTLRQLKAATPPAQQGRTDGGAGDA